MLNDKLQLESNDNNDSDDLQKKIDQTYQKLDEKCDIIIEKIKRSKRKAG